MHKFIVLLIFVGLGYLGYVIWKDVEKKRAVSTGVAAPSPTPAPEVSVTPAPPPEAEAKFAPESVLFVVRRFSESLDGGVRGFSPGMEVRMLRQDEDHYVVTDGVVESRRPRSWFTRDIGLAEELREQKRLTDGQIAKRQAAERAAYEAAERAREERWAATLDAVEAGRSAARVSAQQSVAGRQSLPPLRLGAWNLEHFGSRNDPPRTEADVQAMADFIRGLGVQVLAVCEINGEKPLKDLVKRIGPDWKFVLGTSGHVGDEGRVAPGVIWDNSRVEMLGAGELSELAGRSASGLIFHRQPVVAAFRDRAGGPDFRVISVHLKAGRTPEDFERREAEATALRGYLQKVVSDTGEDDDVIIMGDFNHCHTAQEAVIWREGAFADFLTGRGRSIIHFDRQIDQAVPLGTFEEIKQTSLTIHNKEGLRDTKKWRNTYSDHFPITVDLEPLPDDDPESKIGVLGRRLR